jgi:hypothetical protein
MTNTSRQKTSRKQTENCINRRFNINRQGNPLIASHAIKQQGNCRNFCPKKGMSTGPGTRAFQMRIASTIIGET